MSFNEKAEEAIPAEVRMISGCHDTQTSADVSNVGSFQLPDPAGRAGGALTSAILNVVYEEHRNSAENLTFMDVFLKTRDLVRTKGFEQVPQFSSSRMIDVNRPFNIMKEDFGGEGTRHAVLIGINYTSHKQGRLSGCHSDVKNIRRYIQDVGKVGDENIVTLMDDGKHTPPTRANIMEALEDLCSRVKPGDTAFVHYSGHGGRERDHTGEEETGYHSTLVPIDFQEAGQIVDDELYENLVCAMPKGSALTCLMDCCHSGSVLDLPYVFVADGEHYEMEPVPDFPFVKILKLLAFAAAILGEGKEERQQRRLERRENRRQERRGKLRENVKQRLLR